MKEYIDIMNESDKKFSELVRNYREMQEMIRKKIDNKEKLTIEDAAFILEDVIDTLCQVGNGVTHEHLHEAADYLFAFRDLWFKNMINKAQNE